MNPPRERLPFPSIFILVCKPWDDNAGRRAGIPLGIPHIPDMTSEVRVIGRAGVSALVGLLLFVAETIDGARSIRRSNDDFSERILQRLKKFLT